MSRGANRTLLALVLAAGPGCGSAGEGPGAEPAAENTDVDDEWTEARARMVAAQVAARGVDDPRVLEAMREVPRHRLVPGPQRPFAYDDRALSIGHGQTISQPYIVGFMTAALELRGDERVLEIGTGSGYQAAVLARLCREVYTIEIVEPLGRQAARALAELGCDNVHARIGDGYRGWPEAAPFDAIIVTAAPDHVPQPLLDQLRVGGRMIVPVGAGWQELVLITKTADGVRRDSVLPVRFVPMTGEARRR